MARILLAAFLFPAVAVNAVAQPASRNAASPMIRLVEDVWNRGDWAAADNLFTPDAKFHYAGNTFGPSLDVPKTWRAAFPDFHFTIEDTLIDGDKVAMRLTFTGTQRGPFWGMRRKGNTSRCRRP
jgi:predicted ester cyclase